MCGLSFQPPPPVAELKALRASLTQKLSEEDRYAVEEWDCKDRVIVPKLLVHFQSIQQISEHHPEFSEVIKKSFVFQTKGDREGATTFGELICDLDELREAKDWDMAGGFKEKLPELLLRLKRESGALTL
jgi:hypothetical protein